MTNESTPPDDSPGRGCGTHRIREAISRLPPAERQAMADLLGDDPALCQPTPSYRLLEEIKRRKASEPQAKGDV
jgi:hypothetical protein